MPRKTLALISGLVIVTVILFVIALRTSNQQTTQLPPTPMAQQPAPTSAAHTMLSLLPNPVNVAAGRQESVSVNIDTSDNAVTAVQLEIAYDPHVLSNLQVTPGQLFPNAVVLINKNNPQTGRMTYAFGIAPNQPTIQGTGAVATITFTAKVGASGASQLALLPTTLVTARGIATSVLKSSSGTIINIGSAGGTMQRTIPVGQ